MFGNFGEMFQHVQKAQEELNKIQGELKNQRVEASVGGGKVNVTANGCQQIVKVRIEPEVISSDPDDIALLEDMVTAAVNQALDKSKSLAQSQMGQLAGGLDFNNIMKMFQK